MLDELFAEGQEAMSIEKFREDVNKGRRFEFGKIGNISTVKLMMSVYQYLSCHCPRCWTLRVSLTKLF